MGSINDPNRFVLPDNLTQDWPIPAVVSSPSVAVGIGDLMYYKSTDATFGDVAYPADQLATLGTEALDQAQFAALFVGVSQEQVLNTEINKNKKITLRTDAAVEMNCPSQTWKKGDLAGVFSNGVALDPQKLDKVTTPGLAIGIVIRDQPVAVTRVRVRLQSRFSDQLVNSLKFAGIGDNQGVGATTLADGNQTLTVASTPFINMVPTAARTITLPIESQSNKLGLVFYITNNSAGAFSITVAAPAAVKGNNTIPQNKTGYYWCDGTNWNGLVSA